MRRREKEGGGRREKVGKGKAETGRDREGEGDVVLLVEVLPVAFIEVHSCGWFDVNCVYRLMHVINSTLICVDINFLDFLTFSIALDRKVQCQVDNWEGGIMKIGR